MTPASGQLQSLNRSIAVLETMTGENRRPTAREIADRLQLDRTVTHRILRTLEAEGLVERQGNGYALGPRTLLFGNSYLDGLLLRHVSLPYQVDLLYRVLQGHPWALSIMLRVGNVVTLASHLWSPTAPLDSLLGVGATVPLEHAAAGRCILAFLPENEVERLLGRKAARALRPRLARIRGAGGIDFITSEERSAIPPGLAALSAIICDRSGAPIAGLTLSGTELEPHLAPDSDVAVRLLRTAEQIGRQLP